MRAEVERVVLFGRTGIGVRPERPCRRPNGDRWPSGERVAAVQRTGALGAEGCVSSFGEATPWAPKATGHRTESGRRPFERGASSAERVSFSGVTATVVRTESDRRQLQKPCRPAGRWALWERTAVGVRPRTCTRRTGSRTLSGHTGIALRPSGRRAPSGRQWSFKVGTQFLECMTAFLGFKGDLASHLGLILQM